MIKLSLKKRRTRYQKLGELKKKHKTYAEKKLESNLKKYKNGFFTNKFEREWVFSKMRLDFFFYETRLAVEVDGPYHQNNDQKIKDKQKYLLCRKNNITLIRFTNGEIYREIDEVLRKIYKIYLSLLNNN